MPLEDYLMPAEQIRFQSSFRVHYGDKTYQVIVTERRILLYAERGIVFKRDDVVTQKLDELQEIKYQERGIVSKRGLIKIQSLKTEMDLWGPAGEVKTLYQQMMQFM